MIREYIAAAMRHARYELIDQPGEPYYGCIPKRPAHSSPRTQWHI